MNRETTAGFLLSLLLCSALWSSSLAQEPPQDAASGTELVTLSFQDISIRRALHVLATAYGVDIVVSDSVAGDITLALNEIPWEQALRLVLHTKSLASRLEGGVLYVAPVEELLRQESAESALLRQQATLLPLRTEFLQINYADAEDIRALLVGSKPLRGRADNRADKGPGKVTDEESGEASLEQGLLSSRGSASVDQRTNTLIVRDVPESLLEVQRLLAVLDVAVRQVIIEARIVEVETSAAKELGARLGIVRPTTRAFDVDLGIGSAAASIVTFASESGRTSLDLALSALESEGLAEIIARPRVTTQDKIAALIQSGVRIPYQSQAGGTAGGSTTEFEEALLSLEVIPHITPDGRINMQLDIRQDSVSPQQRSAPIINTNQIVTRALVYDGETIVLGGVFRESLSSSESRTPLLGELPYIGRLFRRTQRESRKTELLVFITPSVLPLPPR